MKAGQRVHNRFFRLVPFVLLTFCLATSGLSLTTALAQTPQFDRSQAQVETIASTPYFTLNKLTVPGLPPFEEMIINGPPTPPPGFEEQQAAVDMAKANAKTSVKTLITPAFNWVFGCSSVSGAMIAGYYDRNGYPNMYTGPTNGGVMPLNNSSWPTWSDGYVTYPNLPLAASHMGVDGRTTKGSIDDYWVSYDSAASDPYITGGWTQHAWSDAIGDYMKTSQSAYTNKDGSTRFWNYLSASKLTCDQMAASSQTTDDGTLGRKQFYEARGYTVTDCYNQKTDNVISGGFSFAQYKAEIDAGHPVMINLAGHTIVGVGYDDATNTVYLHDTWNYDTHTMPWGDTYTGMAMQSVSIVNLAAAPPVVQRAEPWRNLLLQD
jgi:predicted SnoaL-like aldol condensation-catalyzing enzyme